MLLCLVFLLGAYLSALVLKSEKLSHIYAYLFPFLACAAYPYSIRDYTAALLVFSFFLSLLILDFKKFLYSLPFWAVGALITLMRFPSLVNFALATVRNPEAITNIRVTGYSIGSSAYGIRFGEDEVTNFYKYLLSFLYLPVEPLPWHVKSWTHLLALPESFLLMSFGIPAILGIGDAILNRKKEHLFLLLTAFLYLASVASFSDNAGANTRLRMVGVILILVMSRFDIFGKQFAL